jgi:hypothetical protein
MDDLKPTMQEFHEGWDFLFFISREAEDGMSGGARSRNRANCIASW